MVVKKKHRKYQKKKSKSYLAALVLLLFAAVLFVVLLNMQNRADDISVKPSDERRSVRQTVYGDFSDMNIELVFGDKKEKISSDTIISWLDVNEKDGKYIFTPDDKKISDYVKTLAGKVDTFNEKIPFTAHDGTEMKILNKSTGWMLDKDRACENLKELIKEKKSVSLNLTDESDESNSWWFRIAGNYGDSQMNADTYAEVSLSEQYMWMVKNNKVVFESSIVSGNPSTGHDTPKGAFILYEKKKNANLYSEDYDIKVAYWMAFCDDVGFHDAQWQESFGGEVYRYSGSHGCVNLPLSSAEELYSLCKVGMPVFVY